MKIAVFNCEAWEAEYVKSHQGLVGKELDISFIDKPLSPTDMPGDTSFEGLVVFVDSAVTKEVIDSFPNLKFIATRSTGYDHIDIKYCKEKNIAVSYVPFYGENTVAEFAFALLLTLSRRIFESNHRLREDGIFSPKGLMGFDLKGKTIGVIGTGRIGKNSVKIAKGFGMNVVAFDTFKDEEFAKKEGFPYLSLEDLLAQSDVITIHVPYMDATHHLINSTNIRKIKKGACIINTSRGAVIETQALVGALKDGHLSGAGLDVLEEEGVIKDEMHYLTANEAKQHDLNIVFQDHVLIHMPNVIVTPHNAFNTKEAIQRILDTTVENIAGFSVGKPTNLVP